MCEQVNINGTVAFVCGGRHFRKKCEFCGQLLATKLCDFPTEPGKTCDAAMCSECATSVGEDRDHCPNHVARILRVRSRSPQYDDRFIQVTPPNKWQPPRLEDAKQLTLL